MIEVGLMTKEDEPTVIFIRDNGAGPPQGKARRFADLGGTTKVVPPRSDLQIVSSKPLC